MVVTDHSTFWNLHLLWIQCLIHSLGTFLNNVIPINIGTHDVLGINGSWEFDWIKLPTINEIPIRS